MFGDWYSGLKSGDEVMHGSTIVFLLLCPLEILHESLKKNIMISSLQFTFSILSLHIEKHRGDWILKFKFSSVPHSHKHEFIILC